MNYPIVIVITGPTASGKSSLSIEVAEQLNASVISADSRQIYRGIPITTAVPSAVDRLKVKHHLLEFLDLSEYYSAAAFESDALGLIDEAAQRGEKYIVVCGGSMMYVDALLYGLDELPTISDAVRERVKKLYAEIGLEGLNAYLENLDYEYAQTVDKENTRRVMHAVELCLQSGNKISDILSGKKNSNRPFKYFKFVIERDRNELFDRINRRVEMMVSQGMEDEARSVYHLRHLNSLNTIGFKEWFAYFDGKMDKATTIARIAKNTRVYAKKQLTWLARQNDIIYLAPVDASSTLVNYINNELHNF